MLGGDQPEAVILDHDGSVDDIIALIVLLACPTRCRVAGCLVTNADCIDRDAVSCCGKVRSLFQSYASAEPFPIAVSHQPGRHAFPLEWRYDAKRMDDLPSLNVPAVLVG